MITLNLGNKPVLNYLKAQFNQISSIDASACVLLKYLIVNNNNLTSLNFKNGNNAFVNLYNSLNNPNLTCIEVDDNTYSTNNWTNIDAGSSFSTNCSLAGCIDVLACNYNTLAWLGDNSCAYASSNVNNLTICNGESVLIGNSTYYLAGSYLDTFQAVNGCDSIINTILSVNAVGCTDSIAFNYIPNAICDDSSCISVVFGCTDSTATNHTVLANTDDGSCIATVYGCTDSTMFNYNPFANTLDSCQSFMYGCMDSISVNYNILANTNDGSCINCSEYYINVRVETANYGAEIGWELLSSSGVIVKFI